MTTWRVVDIIRSSTDFLAKKGVPDPRLDAEALLGHVINKNRLELYLFFDRPLDNRELDRYREYIKRRGNREPLQHILGDTGFMDLIVKTSPDALIPRPETEVLANQAISLMGEADCRILDIGTGTGCIALSLAQGLPQAKILGVDISTEALSLAKENALHNELEVRFQQVNILEELPKIESRFDLVVSNPPYIPASEKPDLQVEVRDFDPPLALFAENNGLAFYERFAEILPELLNPGGRFLFEFGGKSQEEAILKIFSNTPYSDLEIIQDLNGDPRVIAGRFNP